jgi:hypothetical protein
MERTDPSNRRNHGLNLATPAAARSVARTLDRRGSPMRRREFLTLIGGAAAWPLPARKVDVFLAVGTD